MKKVQKKTLQALLLEANIMTPKVLQDLANEQEKTGKGLEEILILKGIVTEVGLLRILSEQLNVPYVDLLQCAIDLSSATKIPEPIARRHRAIAIGAEKDKLRVAMTEPLNIYALDDIRISTKMEILPVLASGRAIDELINQVYISAQTKHIVFQVEKELQEEKQETRVAEREMGEDSSKVQLVNNLLERCILDGASDLHIEPFERVVCVRYRVDGQLREVINVSKETLSAITSHIKVVSGLDIAERRLPQDGRMSKIVKGQKVDLRISILPTIYGEKTVIRFIYRTEKKRELSEIGFFPEDYIKVENLLKNPHGIILLTGPTGSGKSTTLAATLRRLNKESLNIVTVEDPVENMLEGINQVAVNHKIGLTFAAVLRAILRQDPDIIMIGEMRDAETSSIAIRAAITGHLVLSTLHTNDAASSIPRLIDMGTEAYMVGAAVKGVISQRLVRKLCPLCCKKHVVTASEAAFYKVPQGIEVYEAGGCVSCHQTGYKGRSAVHEVLVMDNQLQEMIASGKTTAEELKEVAKQKGMRTLWENAYYNVRQGTTTLEEMLRITYEQ